MGRLAVFAVLLAGCYRAGAFPCDGASCEATEDSSTDGDGDGGVAVCVGAPPGLLGEKCFVPSGLVVFNNDGPFNTETNSLCNPDETTACFITASDIEITARVNVTGARPLVLWSAGSITIKAAGYLDVASHSGNDKKVGPGSNPNGCVAGIGDENAMTVPNIGGGGTGGAYRSAGGGGGGARNTSGTIINGIVGPGAEVMSFRGGCNGGKGGYGNSNVGFGGGAVYLMAKRDITVAGVIDASGSGGTGAFKNGATRYGGGNGGGSGGLIGLEAPEIKLGGARLAALGGGGGSGAANNGTIDGQDPQADPPTRAPATQATTANNGGGAGCPTTGGNGETGGSVTTQSGGEGGGGGGGGGCGFIMTLGATDEVGAILAPPATPPPM